MGRSRSPQIFSCTQSNYFYEKRTVMRFASLFSELEGYYSTVIVPFIPPAP